MTPAWTMKAETHQLGLGFRVVVGPNRGFAGLVERYPIEFRFEDSHAPEEHNHVGSAAMSVEDAVRHMAHRRWLQRLLVEFLASRIYTERDSGREPYIGGWLGALERA